MPRRKSNAKVPNNPSLYLQTRSRVSSSLQESRQPFPSERLLQLVWHHQRIVTHQIQTLDGTPLRILHPGFWNHEAGPDFRQAVVQFGSESPRSGDVEVDLLASSWRTHGHHLNPAYRKTILHVVWRADIKEPQALPTLVIESLLDAPLEELITWLGNESMNPWPDRLAGQCSAPLRDLPEPAVRHLLEQAAKVRLQRKALEFQARARQAGWEQSLWEGLFGGLGYKHNFWPMRRLAEMLPQILPSPPHQAVTLLALQARLLGLSGLLPSDLTRSRTTIDQYLRRIWDLWWRDRQQFIDLLLPRSLWRFNGLRPANHPQRRLALAAHWLLAGDLPAKLQRWLIAPIADQELVPSLLESLQTEPDDFWAWHWTFRSARRRQPQPLLGPQRVTDLAMNVILPWGWVRAHAGQNHSVRDIAEQRYFSWPKGEDNSLLRLARRRLLASAHPKLFHTAARQQGLLQIVRDFCDHSNAICSDCPFPDFVRRFHPKPS